MAIALPDDHPLANRKAIDLAELSDETFLSLHEKHFPGRPELMKSMFERAGIAPRIALKADGLSSLLGQVGGGNGVALVPADADVLPHTGVAFGKLRRPKVTLISSAVLGRSSRNTSSRRIRAGPEVNSPPGWRPDSELQSCW